MKNGFVFAIIFSTAWLSAGWSTVNEGAFPKEPQTFVSVAAEPNEDVECFINENVDESLLPSPPLDRELRIAEVVDVWTMFFDDQGAKKDDPRREKFQEYATYVVNAADVVKDKLHDYKNMHILVATLITLESSVTAGLVGKRGEVGLMQTWGVALNGVKPEEVHKDPNLGIVLGVNFLVKLAEEHCPGTVYDHDWTGAVSVYGSGPNGLTKDGKCKIFPFAKERVMLAQRYHYRIHEAHNDLKNLVY